MTTPTPDIVTEAKQGTPRAVLIERLMDSRVAKSEMEWAAAAELARLRKQVRVLREECKAWKAWSNAIGGDDEDVTWEALKQAQDATSAMENP